MIPIKHLSYLAILLLIGSLISCKSQKNISPDNSSDISSNKIIENNKIRGDYRIMFYNCENLFDIYNDSLKRDDDFTPDGVKHWSKNKYYDKLANISKVITAVGGWEPPELVGLCEIENYFVLKQLTEVSLLKVFKYKIIHYESPDKRGIDVALLYIPSKFTPIKSKNIPVVFKDNGRPTRDILYVKGTTTKKDTLHIFVNHWPSRWGGMLETEHKRMYVASVLQIKVDSIFRTDKSAKIIIMGDLNDFPTNKSLIESLKTSHNFDNIKSNQLYNLAWYLQEEKGLFSHSFHGEAGVLDQMIVSGALLDSSANIYMTKDNAHILNAKFLLENDPNYVGEIPFRTYLGMKYHGGFSDHLPVYIDLFLKK